MWCSSLSKLLSFHDWTTAVFNWPALSYSATKPLQMIQNTAELLFFNQPKRTDVTPLLISLHWLIVAARIRFETLSLTFRDCQWTRTLLLQCTPTSYSHRMRGALMFMFKKGQSHFPLSPHSAPLWWNELPTSIRSTENITTFKKQLKTHIFLKLSTTLNFRHLEEKV